MDIRQTAYKMDIDSNAAEKLSDEVGEELAVAVLEKVRKKMEYQATFAFHPRMKTAGYFFGVLARNCLVEFKAKLERERLSEELRQSRLASQEAKASGFQPDGDGLLERLEHGFQEDEFTYKDLALAKKFLHDMEEIKR